MRSTTFPISLMVLGIFALPGQSRATTAAAPLGTITSFIGSVSIMRNNVSLKARLSLPLFAMDILTTGEESRCEIRFGQTRVARFDENTTTRLSSDQTGQPNLTTLTGSIWINVKKLTEKENFSITTPTATAAIRGTIYSVDCSQNGADFFVHKGTIGVSPLSKTQNQSAFSITVGEQFTLVHNVDTYCSDLKKAFEEFASLEEDAIKDFENTQNSEIADFNTTQNQAYADFIAQERKQFKSLGSYHYAQRHFDATRLPKKKWIDWNKQLDLSIGW